MRWSVRLVYCNRYPSRRLVGRLQAPAPTTSVDAVAVVNVGGHGSHLWLFILGGNFGAWHSQLRFFTVTGALAMVSTAETHGACAGHLHIFIIDMHKFRQQSTNGMMTSEASVSQESRVIHRRNQKRSYMRPRASTHAMWSSLC